LLGLLFNQSLRNMYNGLMIEMRKFTAETLAQYNGKNGASAYIAYAGKVYDVTNSFLWQKGKHQVIHHAGVDCTTLLNSAPHGADLIYKFPQVGEFIVEHYGEA
jgi:predicted heme/steroid binding protein